MVRIGTGPPFWQINHANSAYFRLFLGYFRVKSATRPPLLDLGLPFLHILDPPLAEPLFVNHNRVELFVCMAFFSCEAIHANWPKQFSVEKVELKIMILFYGVKRPFMSNQPTPGHKVGLWSCYLSRERTVDEVALWQASVSV